MRHRGFHPRWNETLIASPMPQPRCLHDPRIGPRPDVSGRGARGDGLGMARRRSAAVLAAHEGAALPPMNAPALPNFFMATTQTKETKATPATMNRPLLCWLFNPVVAAGAISSMVHLHSRDHVPVRSAGRVTIQAQTAGAVASVPRVSSQPDGVWWPRSANMGAAPAQWWRSRRARHNLDPHVPGDKGTALT